MTNTDLVVAPVRTKKDWEDFILLPWRIYKDDRNWVPYRARTTKWSLDTKKNPIYCHSEREIFLARRKNEPVGRIVGIIDYNYINHHNTNIGLVGMFETIPDYEVAKALLDKVAEYFQSKLLNEMCGPAMPVMIDQIGLLIDNFDSRPTYRTSYNPKYYVEYFEQYGFKKSKDYYAFLIDLTTDLPVEFTKTCENLKKSSNLTIRNFDLRKLSKDLDKKREIYNDSWKMGCEFAPVFKEVMYGIVKKIRLFLDPALNIFIENPKEPIATAAAIPDVNQILKSFGKEIYPWQIFKFKRLMKKIDTIRLAIMAINWDYINQGMEKLLLFQMLSHAKMKGYKYCEVSYVQEDHTDFINLLLSINAQKYKTFRFYCKPI
ncbi:MAG: hypothetical protein N2201_04080 [candidate division WOR-3 bacterium]|nr:hypothetical protein [candidate division WOR-3 bacterium]